MHLELLEFCFFRNLAEQKVEFPARVTLIIGSNGQGKTSVIEAVYLLAHAKSFRSSKVRELHNWGESARKDSKAFVRGVLRTDSGSKELCCALQGGKRQVFLNGNKLETASSFYGQLNCIVFTPDDVQIIKGAPSFRRSFLDRILAMSDRGYVEHLVAYQRALKSRNKLLSEKHQTAVLLKEIEPWNVLLFQHGSKVMERRQELIAELIPLSAAFYQSLAIEYKEVVSLHYRSHFLDSEGNRKSKNEVFEEFRKSLERDQRSKSSSIGVHRDDMEITIDTGYGDKDSRQGASQGQARSIALSLKCSAVDLLHSRTGEMPILLLDDVESELDSCRKKAFYALLNRFQSQVIITSTAASQELLESCSGVEIVKISAGEIKRQNNLQKRV